MILILATNNDKVICNKIGEFIMPKYVTLKKSHKFEIRTRQTLQTITNKWGMLKQKVKQNVLELPKGIIRLRRPRTFVEWMFYLFLIQLILLAFLRSKANAQNVVITSVNNSHNGANIHHPNITASNNSIPMAHLLQQQSINSPIHTHTDIRWADNIDLRAAESASEKETRITESVPNSHKNTMSIQLEKNIKDARDLVTTVKKVAPAKLNRPIKSVIVGSTLQRNNGFDNSPEQIAQNKLLVEHQEFIQTMINNLVYDLRDELLKMAHIDTVVVNGATKANAVKQFFMDIQIYVIDEFLLKIYAAAAAAAYFKGGNCNSQTSIAINEALNNNLSVEKIELINKYNSADGHAFAVIGRRAGSNLSDISTWGNDWVIIDYWAYDNRLITAERFRKNPEQYSLYTVEKWKWGVISYEANPLEKYRQHEYSQKYAPVKAYLKFCLKKVNYIRQLTFEYFYEKYEHSKQELTVKAPTNN